MDDPFQLNTNNALSPGQVFLERYTLVKFLGRGGMGQVWLVKDSLLGEEIALKFLPSEVMMDRAALEDLKRETLRSRKLSHPHIIKVYDFATAHNSGAISMEYAAGGTLADVRYDLPGMIFDARDPSFIRWMIQLAEALTYAHETAGIVHRDLKPQNLMLDVQANLKLTDFGVARSLADSMSRLSRQNAGSSGTHIYMSPQQAQGRSPSASDDIYAFGATVYDLLTSKPPFFRGNIQHQIDSLEPDPMNQRRAELVEDIEHPTIPQYWEDLVAGCLKKLPEQRPATMREIGGYLVSCSQQPDQIGPPSVSGHELYVIVEAERICSEKLPEERERVRLEMEARTKTEASRRAEEKEVIQAGVARIPERNNATQDVASLPRKAKSAREGRLKVLPWISASFVVLAMLGWGMMTTKKPPMIGKVAVENEAAIRREREKSEADARQAYFEGQSAGLAAELDKTDEAIKSYRKAAVLNDPDAMVNLGYCYEKGEGVTKDETEAFIWYRKAADLNQPMAINNLGVFYRDGTVVTKDEAEAAKWFRKAAELNEPLGMTNLGACYQYGRGVTKNEEEALKWIRKAAELGEKKAKKYLDNME